MFDWQTEEDESVWEDEPAAEPKTAVSGKRPWRVAGLFVALVVIAGILVTRQVQKQADAVVADVESDILSTHELIRTAAKTADADLMHAMLSGRDMDWALVQQQLVADDLLFGRAPFGMSWLPAEHIVVESMIDPALEAAEIRFKQSYEVVNGEGMTETIALAYTAVYRRGSQRWLSAPLESEFWGEWASITSDRLVLVYPQRDAEIAQQLFVDLEAVVAQACATLADLECDQSRQIRVRLEKDAGALAALHDFNNLYRSGLNLELPTPSLVGVPVDDAGYEALLRGYAGLVVTAVIADAVGRQCCDHAPVFQAFVDYQLGTLNLRPWPVTLADHVALWEGEQLISLDDLFSYWEQDSQADLTESDLQFIRAAVDFLLQQYPDQSAAALQRTMSGRGVNFLRWVRDLPLLDGDPRFVSPSALISSLDQEWRLYALLQKEIAEVETLPIPLPEQDIQLLCMDEFENASENVLARYEAASGTWVEERRDRAFSLIYPLAQDEAILLLQLDFNRPQQEEMSTIEIWNESTQQNVLEDGRYALTLGQMDPTGRYLAAIADPADGSIRQPIVFILLDLEDCDEIGCTSLTVPGSPTWSPSGEKAIYMAADFLSRTPALPDGRVWMIDDVPTTQVFPLYLTDRLGQPLTGSSIDLIGSGHAPFWLDENRYGFVQTLSDPDNQQIMVASVGESPEVILETADLLAALPNNVRLGRLLINYVIPYPPNPNHLFVVVSDIDAQGYVLLVDLETGTVEHRLSIGFLFNHLLGFSPDGRFLVTNSAKREQDLGNVVSDFITIHDVAQNQTQDFLFDASDGSVNFVFDWSADGNWLLMILDDGLLQLIAPAYNYRQVLAHEFGECQMVAWVNP